MYTAADGLLYQRNGKGRLLGPVLKKKIMLLEAVCNIIMSARWQVIGKQGLPHVGLKFWIFLKLYFLW